MNAVVQPQACVDTASIRNRMMLVSLNISQWAARKLDKRATEEVAIKHNADLERAGRYSKSLIAKDCLADIQGAVSEARKTHYLLTLPWSDEGYRVLTSDAYQDYTQSMLPIQHQFDQAVRQFARGYPIYVQDARAVLGTLYNDDDYPDAHDIEGRFNFEVKFMPVPDGADFRVDIGDSEVRTIANQINNHVHEAQRSAIKDCYQRIATHVGNMYERLSKPDAVFRDSLIGNLLDLVDVLPKLNFIDDPELNGIIAAIKRDLCKVPVQTLRQDKDARQEVANKAGNILEKVNKWTF